MLFVESSIAPPGGHVDGLNGIIASGYTPGVDFQKADASTLNAELDTTGGLDIVDFDAQGDFMSIAGVRESVPASEPAALSLLAIGLVGPAALTRRRRR